jgi:hypothetical protein
LFVDEGNVHMAQVESWKNKNIHGFYTKTTQKAGFSKLCVKIYKRRYTGMNIARVNIEYFTGCKRIKQRRISFVLGYLGMIL